MKAAGLAYDWHDSPIGPLLLAGDGEALHVLGFSSGPRAVGPHPGWRRDGASFTAVRAQLDAYFAGELRRFELKLAPHGTAFQIRVWWALADIPYGETRSYGDMARGVGEPVSASRAVGAANGANPLPIILPCHRVIGADGSLTGFGGGLPTKRFLLKLEGALPADKPQQLSLL